ncbi:MAG: DUF721 domain-containing protein [Fidelibacterota bacterium]
MAIPIGKAIDKMLAKLQIDKSVRLWQAVSLWEEVVGETIANHTRAEKVQFGKLYVSVDSPTWRNELIFQKKELLDKINSKLQGVKIKEIVLR